MRPMASSTVHTIEFSNHQTHPQPRPGRTGPDRKRQQEKNLHHNPHQHNPPACRNPQNPTTTMLPPACHTTATNTPEHHYPAREPFLSTPNTRGLDVVNICGYVYFSPRAVGAVVAHFPDTEGVTSSNLVSPTRLHTVHCLCGHSLVGKARPCQGRDRGFESRCPLSCSY